MYKVGDRVRVKDNLIKEAYYGSFYFSPYMETYTGRSFTVDSVRKEEGDKYYTLDGTGNWHWSDEMLIEIEKVEESKEMTFPEMVQKLIDGEFKVGTELVREDGVNNYFVDRLPHDDSYGLTNNVDSLSVLTNVGAVDLNSYWSVKEEPIKEMSMEELQQELGYKIKIVE